MPATGKRSNGKVGIAFRSNGRRDRWARSIWRFFFTAAIESLKWGVHYYASVQSVRLASRRQLLPDEAEHPRAGDQYYRIGLGALIRLECPVPSRRLRRVTFIHTTLTRLLEAEDVSDLWIKQPLRERLWVEFNRQGIHAEPQASLREGAADYQFDFLIPCQEGMIAVDCRLPLSEDASIGVGRETPASYPPSEDERVLDELRCSWLRFDDPGWSTNLEPYIVQVWKEIERRGGQKQEPAGVDTAGSSGFSRS